MAYGLQDVMTALRRADAAGNYEDARKLAAIADRMRQDSGFPTFDTKGIQKEPETGFMPAMRAGFEELKGAAGALEIGRAHV